MGLASHFGDEAYRCNNCGHTIKLYAPCCPKCLDKSLTPINVKVAKQPESFRVASEELLEPSTSGPSVVTLAAIAIILAIVVAASTLFAPPRPKTVTQPEVSPSVLEPAAKPVVPRNSVKRSKRLTNRPVVSRTRSSSTASSPSSKPATPMKLWVGSSDDEE